MSKNAQLEVFPDELTLHRIDPNKKMRRFYRLTVQRDLFGGATLLKEWGRIGLGGQLRSQLFSDEGFALNALAEMAAKKTKRGYKP